MRLTNLTDYAMRVLMYLGRHPGRLCTIAEVAQAYGISEPHLMKVTHRLARNGWVHTVRGKHGGMRLAREPGAIPLGAVIRDTENDLDLVECLGAHSSCSLSGECGLAYIVQGALQAFMDHLDQHTLADLLPPVAAAEAPVRLVRSNRSVS